MKRQLSIQYENIVNLINDKKKHLRLAQIITYFRFPPKQYADIFYKLYADKNDTDEMLDYAIPIIVDIYNDNYELEEPKYYWKFKELTGKYVEPFYAFKYLDDCSIGLKVKSELGDNSIVKMSKTYLDSMLSETNLTSDNFKAVEELE